MRVAILNGAQYEADQHAPLALKEGVSEAQLRRARRAGHTRTASTPRSAPCCALTDAMTRDVHVAPDAVDTVRAHLGDRELVELVATIAAYNMVSRFLEALQIRSDDTRGPALGPQTR